MQRHEHLDDLLHALCLSLPIGFGASASYGPHSHS